MQARHASRVAVKGVAGTCEEPLLLLQAPACCAQYLTADSPAADDGHSHWLRSLSISAQLVPEPVRRVQGGLACKLSRQQGCGLPKCSTRGNAGMQPQLRAGSQAWYISANVLRQSQCLSLRPGLQAQVADLQADCQSLRKEIAERADIIQEDFQTMRQQRQDVLQLEKQLFVTEHRKQVHCLLAS